jgi:hypothetical protein
MRKSAMERFASDDRSYPLSSKLRPDGFMPRKRELANEREVIRRHTRKRRAMNVQICRRQSWVHKNVIDR